MTFCRSTIALICLLGGATPLLSAAEALVSKSPAFTATIPAGFEPSPELKAAKPDAIQAYHCDIPDDNLGFVLFFEKMGGPIGQERLTAKDMPPDFKGRLFTVNWQGFEVDAFAVPEDFEGSSVVTYNVQIPLQRRAIQVKLFGSRDRDAELQGILKTILEGLRGESNWSSTNAGLTANNGVAIAAAIVLGGLVVLYLISRVTPPGTTLGVAIALYVVTMVIEQLPNKNNSVQLVSGAIRLLAVGGGIAGVIEVIRKNHSKTKQPPGESKPQDSTS